MSEAAGRVYLDHNATSPVRPEAAAAARSALEMNAGNPSSLHAEGRAARRIVEAARAHVAALAGAPPKDVVFTSGGSEAISAAVHGVCSRSDASQRRIVVSAIEHSAVLEAARAQALRGFHVIVVPCTREGAIEAQPFIDRIEGGTALAALQLANNETGVLQPVEEIAQACAEIGVPLLVDAVQAAGKIPIDRASLGSCLLAVSSHKLGGPQGAGALIVRETIAMSPLIRGGAQERRRRGGTEAVASIAGFGAAAAAARASLDEEGPRLAALRDRFERALLERFPNVRIHGASATRVPNTSSFALHGVPGETLAIALDVAGFAVSTGSACASGAVEPSHVIRAMGHDDRQARGAVRVSLGWSTTPEQIERFAEALFEVVEQVRAGIASRP